MLKFASETKQKLYALISTGYSDFEISTKFKAVKKAMLTKSSNMAILNFERIASSDVKLLFESYDLIFFNNLLSSIVGDKLTFSISSRMTKSGGMTFYNKKKINYKITLSAFLLFNSFNNSKEEIIVNGIVCLDRLEAAMRIFEHELIHLIELLLFGKSSCSLQRFKNIARNFFRHTETVHKLITQNKKAALYHDIHIGDTVLFDLDKKNYQGIVHKITKRATVFVPSQAGNYQNKSGKRFLKFYIPLGMLRKPNK